MIIDSCYKKNNLFLGSVISYFNDFSHVIHCIPQKLHRGIHPSFDVEPKAIERTQDSIRPFHCILLVQVRISTLDHFFFSIFRLSFQK